MPAKRFSSVYYSYKGILRYITLDLCLGFTLVKLENEQVFVGQNTWAPKQFTNCDLFFAQKVGYFALILIHIEKVYSSLDKFNSIKTKFGQDCCFVIVGKR